MIEKKSATAPENRYTVKIMGDEYVIRGADDPEYMEEIAFFLETAIGNIAVGNQKLNKCQTAVLAAFKIADELHKLRQDYHCLEELLKEESSKKGIRKKGESN